MNWLNNKSQKKKKKTKSKIGETKFFGNVIPPYLTSHTKPQRLRSYAASKKKLSSMNKVSINPFLLLGKPKQISKRDLSWPQAKRRFPNLHPMKDTDGDGVINLLDCKPFDKKRQDVLQDKRRIRIKKLKRKEFDKITGGGYDAFATDDNKRNEYRNTILVRDDLKPLTEKISIEHEKGHFKFRQKKPQIDDKVIEELKKSKHYKITVKDYKHKPEKVHEEMIVEMRAQMKAHESEEKIKKKYPESYKVIEQLNKEDELEFDIEEEDDITLDLPDEKEETFDVEDEDDITLDLPNEKEEEEDTLDLKGEDDDENND